MDKMIQETLKHLDESIEDLNKKKDLTSSDLEILCKAYKLKMELEGYGNPDDGYSERSMEGSYGGNSNRSNRGYYNGSYAPVRSQLTGRFVSRDGYGMSGHSIKDRMIARLEAMYDDAQSEHERDEIRNEIRQIQANQ